MTLSLPARAGRRCHNALNPLHSTLYFSPDLGREFGRARHRRTRAPPTSPRAAPRMGAVGAGRGRRRPSTTSTTSWWPGTCPPCGQTASPAGGARRPGCAPPTRRCAGCSARRSSPPEMAEAASWPCAPPRPAPGTPGRCTPPTPICRCPSEPHLAYWHAATLLREHRGDGHLAALLAAGLDPVEALVSHTATGKGMAPRWVLATRGWRRADWEAAADGCASADCSTPRAS